MYFKSENKFMKSLGPLDPINHLIKRGLLIDVWVWARAEPIWLIYKRYYFMEY